jgi:hypothetical protein
MSATMLRKLVTSERLRRGWSVRVAAAKSDNEISNTTWGRYEAGDGQLTPNVQRAVSAAFKWPANWPDPEVAETLVSQPSGSELLQRVEVLSGQVEALILLVEKQGAEIAKLRRRVDREGT